MKAISHHISPFFPSLNQTLRSHSKKKSIELASFLPNVIEIRLNFSSLVASQQATS